MPSEPPPSSIFQRILERLQASSSSRYTQANLVYLLYVSIILFINLSLSVKADAAYNDEVYYESYDYATSSYLAPQDTLYQQRMRGLNSLYVAAGVIHLLNAFQYIFAWMPLGFGLLHPVMIPEYLNILGAALYLWSASLYNPGLTDYTTDASGKTIYGLTVLRIHEIETASSLIEVFAAIGWCVVWAFQYTPGPGRGYTLDDPDFTGNVLILVPSLVYFVYNVQNLRDPNSYGTNLLYQTGDSLYFAGAVFFMLSALRDDGWFPSLGLWPLLRGAFGLLGMGPCVDALVDRLYWPCSQGSQTSKGAPLLDAEAAETEPLAGQHWQAVAPSSSTGAASTGVYAAWRQ